MNLVAEVGFDQSFSFIYSRRPGTPAAALPDEVPHEVKQQRLELLQRRLNGQARAISERMVGSRSACSSNGPPSATQGRSPAYRQQSLGQFRRSVGRSDGSHQQLCGRDHYRGYAEFPARTTGRPPPTGVVSVSAMTRDVLLAPADNVRLVELCGPLDEHLHQIEARLGVEVRRRGNRFFKIVA